MIIDWMIFINCWFQALVTAISQVRFDTGKTPSVVRQFFIDQLRYNDNTSNPVIPRFICSWGNADAFLSSLMVSTSVLSYLQLPMLISQRHPQREENSYQQKPEVITPWKILNLSSKLVRKLIGIAAWTGWFHPRIILWPLQPWRSVLLPLLILPIA